MNNFLSHDLTPSSLAPGPWGTLSKCAFSRMASRLGLAMSTSADNRATTFVKSEKDYVFFLGSSVMLANFLLQPPPHSHFTSEEF